MLGMNAEVMPQFNPTTANLAGLSLATTKIFRHCVEITSKDDSMSLHIKLIIIHGVVVVAQQIPNPFSVLF